MSIRRRFLFILTVSILGLGAATLGIVRLLMQGMTERERIAFELTGAAAQAIAARLDATSAPPALDRDLVDLAERAAAPLVDGGAGVCGSDGGLILTRVVGAPFAQRPGAGRPPRDPGPPRDLPEKPDGPYAPAPNELLPFDQKVIQETCRAQRPGEVLAQRFEAPSDQLFVTVQGTARSTAAWALVRVPSRPKMSRGWALLLGVFGALTLLIVVVTAQALVVLRRGSDELRAALVKLSTDLSAEVPRPRAEELRRVADGLRDMASRLIEAHERERLLERRLGQEERLAALGRVVAGVAHEVRNPLAAMKLNLDRMKRRGLDDRSARDVAVCVEEIARLDKIVSSLLLVARKDPPEKAPLDLAELAAERAVVAASLADPRGVRVVCEGAGEVLANRGHLTRVLDNLLRNAIEASPDGAEVRVEIAASDAGATIAVTDRGDGVPPDREGELFEPFFTLRPEGTGLGLFLSHSLVEAHGGQLTYRRDDFETRFLVTLPRS